MKPTLKQRTPLTLHSYDMTLRKFLRHPVLFLTSIRVWLFLRDHYGVEITPGRVRLFPVYHIVLTDDDLIAAVLM